MMFSWLSNKISARLRSWRRHGCMKQGGNGDSTDDESSNNIIWRKNLERHSCGEFSFAAVQANENMEDHSQVETGYNAIFVGVYDGHGGTDASSFINDRLFQNLIRIAQENGTISEESLSSAFLATEDGFLTLVHRGFLLDPKIASKGSCCLVGVIWKGTLYIANLGDSRAVIGSTGAFNRIIARQLTVEHNANREEIRQELRAQHPQDPQIVVRNDGTWRVKGIIQVSRSIGDIYLKQPGYTDHSSMNRFRPREPIRYPVLTAEPSLSSRVLQPADRFLIFASDGLWEHITNQKAAEIVHRNPRNGIARRLLKAALKEAARKNNMNYKDLQKVALDRRRFHDDITVIVVFIDHELLGKKATVPELSFKGFVDSVGPSIFRNIQELM